MSAFICFDQKSIRRCIMQKAIIIIQNSNNTTKRFGEEIANFLLKRGLMAELIPINSFEPRKLEGADYLLLSGWRNDHLFSKNPDSEWSNFIKKLPTLKGVRTALFTTYKLFSNRLIKKMKKELSEKTEELDYAFTSRDGSLSIPEKMAINDFIR
jgi:flavodoxin